MDSDAIDVKDFGHLLEPQATRQALNDGLGLLRRAQTAAATEMKAIQQAMDNAFRLGRGRK